MGYLNLIVMELNLVTLHQRNMLLCTEWWACFYLGPIAANCSLQLRCPDLRQRYDNHMQTM